MMPQGQRRSMAFIMCQIIGIERVAPLHIGPLGREISLVVRIVMQLCKIAEEVLGLHLQTLPAGVVKKVFILKELKIQPAPKRRLRNHTSENPNSPE